MSSNIVPIPMNSLQWISSVHFSINFCGSSISNVEYVNNALFFWKLAGGKSRL